MSTYAEVKALLDKWDREGGIKTSAYYRLEALLHTLPRTLGDTAKARAVIVADSERMRRARAKRNRKP